MFSAFLANCKDNANRPDKLHPHHSMVGNVSAAAANSRPMPVMTTALARMPAAIMAYATDGLPCHCGCGGHVIYMHN
jgi:hypothetical protein